MPDGEDWNGPAPRGYRGLKPFLEAHTDSAFPGYNLGIPDKVRADIWIRALGGWVTRGEMPAMQIVRLPNDHTSGAAAGKLSPFWRNTAVFVLEDDAQNGPDHVDSHRSVLLVISAWNRGGVIHRWANTTDVIATMEEILGLGQLSQFDYFGRPLRQIWADRPDLRSYQALVPQQSLTERNPEGGPGAAEAAGLDFSFEDVAEEDDFNLSLWLAIKGPGTPYPGTTRLNGLELRQGAAVLGPKARR